MPMRQIRVGTKIAEPGTTTASRAREASLTARLGLANVREVEMRKMTVWGIGPTLAATTLVYAVAAALLGIGNATRAEFLCSYPSVG